MFLLKLLASPAVEQAGNLLRTHLSHFSFTEGGQPIQA